MSTYPYIQWQFLAKEWDDLVSSPFHFVHCCCFCQHVGRRLKFSRRLKIQRSVFCIETDMLLNPYQRSFITYCAAYTALRREQGTRDTSSRERNVSSSITIEPIRPAGAAAILIKIVMGKSFTPFLLLMLVRRLNPSP